MTARDYKIRFGLPIGRGLVADATREKFAAAIKATIAAGTLDDHFACIAAGAREANALSLRTLAEMRRRPVRGCDRKPEITRETIEAVITLVEGGSIIASAVKRVVVSTSGLHTRLQAFPDLVSRLAAAKVRRRSP